MSAETIISFVEILLEVYKRRMVKLKNIILCCNAGMSTSMLVKKMKEAAKEKGVEVEINSIPIDELKSHLINAGVVLLGPQVKYMLEEVKEVIGEQNIVADTINTMDYGMMKGEKVLKSALTLMNK